MRRAVDAAASVARGGGLVVYPTDTLWGLGARFDDAAAVERVFAAKARPRDQPLSLAVADADAVAQYGRLTPVARRLLALLPGPLTLVLDRTPAVPPTLTGGQPTVGIRVPGHPVARALLRAAGPLTATSANRHGESDPRTLDDARRQLGDRVDYYLASPTPPLGAPSTLVDARGAAPRILRLGAVKEDEIRGCLAD